MKPLRWVVTVLIAAVAIVGSFLTWKIKGEPTDPPMSALHDRPECGHDWADSVRVDEIKDIINVPEFHDCQRFIVKDGATYTYDKTFAIFVSQTIGTLEARLASPVPSSGVSTVVTTPGTPPPINVMAGMVAVVYAEGPYATLGIETGLNCLYVWRIKSLTPPPSPQVDLWSARMVPKGAAKSCPDAPLAAIGGGKDLKVSRTQVEEFKNDTDYPPVTRWDWDKTHDKQYVGVKCGTAWCEIYDDELDSSPPLAVTSSDSAVRRVRLIKGWYDQQYLATFDAGGKPVPSGIMATIVPDPKLGEMNDDQAFKNNWVHVADISLGAKDADDAAVEKYTQKFNFVRASVADPVTLETKWKPGQALWKARIKRPGLTGWLTLKHKNVKRRVIGTSPGSYNVPGVARWRWMVTDEGSWIRCTGGCCEMSDY